MLKMEKQGTNELNEPGSLSDRFRQDVEYARGAIESLAVDGFQKYAGDRSHMARLVKIIVDTSLRQWVERDLKAYLQKEAMDQVGHKAIDDWLRANVDALLSEVEVDRINGELTSLFGSSDIAAVVTDRATAKRALATRLGRAGYSDEQIAEQLGVSERVAEALRRSGEKRIALLLEEVNLYHPEIRLREAALAKRKTKESK